jgi:hypothetical protein
MNKEVYNWLVKEGDLVIFRNEDHLHVSLNNCNEGKCLLTKMDTIEIIEVFTKIAQEIWESEGYIKKPYLKNLFTEKQGNYSWDIDGTELAIGPAKESEEIQIAYDGNNELNIEINYAVEMIQIMQFLIKDKDN